MWDGLDISGRGGDTILVYLCLNRQHCCLSTFTFLMKLGRGPCLPLADSLSYTQKVPHFRKPLDVSFPMVVPWIWFSIWIFWVIHVLVFLVFQVFSTAELISLAKTVNLAVWAFSLIFLHDFTLFGIDMHNIYHISSISTTFGPLWNMGFPGLDPNLHIALCRKIRIKIRVKLKFLF